MFYGREQIKSATVIDKPEYYCIYALANSFTGRQTVHGWKLRKRYMMHLIQSKANSNAFIPNSLHFLFCFSFSQWMWLNKLMESILRSGARNLLFL